MVPLYVPGCKPLLTAPTESVVGALPLVMLKESQEGALAIFQACEVVQAEESVRLTVSAVGSACWLTLLYESIPGEICSVHCGRTTRVTKTLCGLFCIGSIPWLVKFTTPL